MHKIQRDQILACSLKATPGTWSRFSDNEGSINTVVASSNPGESLLGTDPQGYAVVMRAEDLQYVLRAQPETICKLVHDYAVLEAAFLLAVERLCTGPGRMFDLEANAVAFFMERAAKKLV